MKLATMTFAAIALCAGTTSTVAVFAADRDYCRDYTEAAIRQANEARQSRVCARQIAYEPARWSLDRRGHFEWCVYEPRQLSEAERDYRAGFLDDCRQRR